MYYRSKGVVCCKFMACYSHQDSVECVIKLVYMLQDRLNVRRDSVLEVLLNAVSLYHHTFCLSTERASGQCRGNSCTVPSIVHAGNYHCAVIISAYMAHATIIVQHSINSLRDEGRTWA